MSVKTISPSTISVQLRTKPTWRSSPYKVGLKPNLIDSQVRRSPYTQYAECVGPGGVPQNEVCLKKCHNNDYIISLQNILMSSEQAHHCYFLIVYPIPQFGQITCFYLPSFPEMVQPSKLLSLRIGGGASFLIKTYLRSTMGTLKWYIGCLVMT